MITTNIRQEIENCFTEEVTKFPLSGPDNMRTDLYGLFYGDKSFGSSVTKKYVPHTREDVITLAEAAAESFDAEVDVRCGWKNGHYVTVGPTEACRKEIKENDTVFPRIVIAARYDGRAFKGSFGMYRDLCDNMAMISFAGSQVSASIHHNSSLQERHGELVASFGKILKNWDNVVEVARQMANRRLNVTEFLQKVYPPKPGTKQSRLTRVDRKDSIRRRIAKERRAQGNTTSPETATAWELWNGVQGDVQHEKSRRGNLTANERVIAAFDDPAIKRAEVALAC